MKKLREDCFKELRKFDTKIAEELKKVWWDESHRSFLEQMWKTARTIENNFDCWRKEIHELKTENKRLLGYIQTGDEKFIKTLLSKIEKRNKQREIVLTKIMEEMKNERKK